MRENWSYYEITQFHDRVRALLNDSSETLISDSNIDLPEKAPTAERVVKAQLPNWQELNDVDFNLFESAIVYLTASFFENYVLSKSAKRKELPAMTIEYYTGNTNIMPLNNMTLKDYSDMLIKQIKGDDLSFDFIGFMVTK